MTKPRSLSALADTIRRPTGRTIARATSGSGAVVAATAAVLAAAAAANWLLARKAERDNPPVGEFLEIDGVRVHYVQRGSGVPVLLLHGNGSMIQDFGSSGLLDSVARKYRVIVFDRPGYGYSDRPRDRVWSPERQAQIIRHALQHLGVSQAIVVGHSWGASVAVALALADPKLVKGLVLASGYYYPTAGSAVGMALVSTPAIPVIGDIYRWTLGPMVGRAIWPLLLRKIFGPASVPDKFDGFPKEMALRPSQLRASAAESGLLIANATAVKHRYIDVTQPTAIIAGSDDRLIDIHEQSERLHTQISGSTFQSVAGAGHMVHQTAPERVLDAIDGVVLRSGLS